jgi:hypothetical protein
VSRVKNYNDFLILEKFDDNIIAELKRLGVTDKDEINRHLYHAHRGSLAKYLQDNGKSLTFGMLHALFKDAQQAKKRTDIKVGVIKAVHRIIPMALAPFFPILAIVGYILGTSRAFNKVIAPILADPGNNYPEFLGKLITSSMKIAEGEIVPVKDRFTRAFVVSDGIVNAVKEEVLREFASYLANKMSQEDQNDEVPEHYIENELKSYLNKRYDIEPGIPLKESLNNESYSDLSDMLLELNDLGYKTEVRKMDKLEFNRTVNYLSSMPETLRRFISEIHRYYDLDELVVVTIVKPQEFPMTGDNSAVFFENQEQYDTFNETIDRIKEYMTGLGYVRRTYGLVNNYVKEYYFKGEKINKVNKR